jgi:hypothetical protein
MPTAEEYVSPDGRLRFVVVASPGGDVALGFDGYPWHTHADILADLKGSAPADAVRHFVNDLISDKSVIAVWGVPGSVRDVWVSEDPAKDAAYPQDGEVIELRYWSGRAWEGESSSPPDCPTSSRLTSATAASSSGTESNS